MIWDCFSFFGGGAELDLLDLRLHELSPVVDKFVLVEATKTHTGLNKPLYYDENQHKFIKFWPKIVHVVVEDMPMTPEQIQQAISPQDRHWLDTGYQLGDNWVRERFQRNQIMRALVDCDPDDIIIIEDADEFVRADIIANLDKMLVDGSNAVQQELRTYYMNWRCTNMDWAGSKILRRRFVFNPSEHRFHTPASNIIYRGGWHFNFLGGANYIQEKLRCYAHQEYNIKEVFSGISGLLEQKKDALGRSYQYEIVPDNKLNLPKYVMENHQQFDKYFWKEYL